MNRIDICKNIIQSIHEYITNPDKLEPHREKKHFIRKRKLSLFQVILYLLYFSKASMFQNLSCIREDLPSLDFPAVSKQALSKARQFISPSLFKELFYLSVDLFYSQLPSRRLWHGYHLFAIDGSKIELKNLESLNIYQDSIVIFDRGYYSENLFRYCVEHGHLCLMRLKEGYNLAKKCSGDVYTFLPGNSKDGTADIDVRVIEVTLDDGTKEYLATNLFDPLITQVMFQELYFYRWPVETKYKELKSRLSMEEFSGATTVSVFQEFFINMLLSNLASLIKNQTDEELLISPRSSNKYRYQANRAFVIGCMKRILPKILCGILKLSSVDQLFQDSLRCRSQIMPGQSFRRKKSKMKGRTHFNNQKAAF